MDIEIFISLGRPQLIVELLSDFLGKTTSLARAELQIVGNPAQGYPLGAPCLRDELFSPERPSTVHLVRRPNEHRVH